MCPSTLIVPLYQSLSVQLKLESSSSIGDCWNWLLVVPTYEYNILPFPWEYKESNLDCTFNTDSGTS